MMKNNQIKVFWIGFAFTAALTAWVYWIWRQKRVVTPEPLVVSRVRPSASFKSVSQPPKATEQVVASDALEEIKGIGPVFANRLNAAGIVTFAQVASTSPDELARITGVTRWDPADWVSEAAKLADAQ
jgi:hypothetical protein